MGKVMVALMLMTLLAMPQQSQTEAPRKPSPFAPSLKQLTDEEEKQLDEIIDRFIAHDTGKLTGPGSRQAISDFHKLGPDATFALIRGLNRGARINHSCPAVTIAKKLRGLLSTTRDIELLEYARENIGNDVAESRHMSVLKDLKVTCTLRKGQLERAGEAQLKNSPQLKGSSKATGSGGKSDGK